VRKLPADVHPIVQALWCQPKCFQAMSAHLAALEETAALATRVTSLGAVPLVVISGGDQPPDMIAKHQELTRLSSESRHVVATGSGHWIQLDQPGLVIAAVRDLVERLRRKDGRES
jgi:pimeloyl-ACP methyl ester carboxylesterase